MYIDLKRPKLVEFEYNFETHTSIAKIFSSNLIFKTEIAFTVLT